MGIPSGLAVSIGDWGSGGPRFESRHARKFFFFRRVPSIFAGSHRSKKKYTGEMESEGRWKAKRKCETRLESWISKAVSSILAGSHRSLPGPIDPKVYWGDGKRGEMESEERGYQCGAILHALL